MSKETFEKWQRLYKREHQSMTWLRCDVDKGKQKKSLVSTLWCCVCRKYEERIGGLKTSLERGPRTDSELHVYNKIVVSFLVRFFFFHCTRRHSTMS